jgi:exonuclease VII small subunit
MAEHTKKGREFGNTFDALDPRNPNNKAYISMIGTATNIPVDRLITKMENISNALDANNELWQRAAMLMGTPKYQLQTKEQNDRDRQQIIDDFYMENTPKATRDIDAIEMLNVKEQKAWLKDMGASKSFIKQLMTQGDRTRAIAYITNELGLDIEKEYEKYDIPVPVRSPEYKKIQDLKKDGQIELLRSYGASKYAIQRLDNEEKRIKLILSIQTQRENSLK